MCVCVTTEFDVGNEDCSRGSDLSLIASSSLTRSAKLVWMCSSVLCLREQILQFREGHLLVTCVVDLRQFKQVLRARTASMRFAIVNSKNCLH